MAATTWSVFDQKQLLSIAKAKRSKAENLRPLQVLALEKFATHPSTQPASLFVADNILTPALRIDILLHLEAQYIKDEIIIVGFNDYVKRLNPENANWMLRMVDSLLDASIKFFNFSIFCDYHSSDHQRDLLIWQMLAQRCPNLEAVDDSRKHSSDRGKGKLLVRDVLPFLSQCRNLQHIKLQEYICDAKDLAVIASNHPNLKTLCVTFELVYFETLKNLFALHHLEELNISWYPRCHVKDKSQMEIDEQDHYYRHFNAECLENLPKLRICWGGEANHNIRSYRGHGVLSLTHLRVCRGSYNFELVPWLEYLLLDRPSATSNFDLVGKLSHLRELELYDVNSTFVNRILELCGHKLKVLTIYSCHDFCLKPFQVLFHCPHLVKLELSECFGSKNDDLLCYKDHVHIGQVQHLKQLVMFNNRNVPSEFTTITLSAPNLEIFYFATNWNLSKNDISHLINLLMEGRILQNLHTLYFYYEDEEENPELFKFLCILVSHAPKLKKLEIWGSKFGIEFSKMELIKELSKFDDFHFVLDICE
ncbi:uncharacterized protein LOC132197469 [Neocloeon triangulifer]|uniref:uncharacterized protein LOC132197469 n=1 Tax=Neocloeon triangulifer TaxID=2078957 RepID=UPI00286EE58D|nr:uncharacterized protein LOC132197469 [Neocloeon triangulifer]